MVLTLFGAATGAALLVVANDLQLIKARTHA